MSQINYCLTYKFIYISFVCLFLLNVVSLQNVCERRPVDTTASKTAGDNGFRIKLAGRPPPEKYTPNHVYTVTVNGTYPNQHLLDFMLVAVPLNARDESTTMGTFQLISEGYIEFARDCPHVVTSAGRRQHNGVALLWTAPPPGSGCIEFRATVVEYTDIWYKDDGALTRVFCEEKSTTESERAPELIPECCACGSAKYTVTFHGTWSRHSHPKDYPTHQRLLHWSNIVGASHNKNYMIWAYNDYATKGIKEVCEFGYTSTLEEEMRHRSQDVRTVIKTSGIWWRDPEGLRQHRMARFSVDKRKHLLSMLSMLGPSPDWCVGVSALDLCLPNCTWAGDQTIDLFPWDAGTDDGLTYMAPNSASNPQQRIHRITSNFPNNPTSPFYENDPLRPLAHMEIKRISPKPGQPVVCTGDEEDYEDEFDLGFSDGTLSDMEMKKKLMMMNSGKCAVTDWRDWSACSVTCGVGMRIRNREYLNPMVDENMCPGIPLMEKENCIGIENTCEDPDEACSATEWSEWSPCSVTCGQGMRERRRYYMRRESQHTCQRNLQDSDKCMADILDCATAHMMKNFTAICGEDRDVGPCRGSFTRWYFDVIMQKCLPFTYGGCRGNNNRFMTMDECTRMCVLGQAPAHPISLPDSIPPHNKPGRHQPRPGPFVEEPSVGEAREGAHHNRDKVDCMVTPWLEWSQCSATCGKSLKTRVRMVKREAEHGGKHCPKKRTKKTRCDVPRCSKASGVGQPQAQAVKAIATKRDRSTKCKLSDWSRWSACSATCGDGQKYKSRSLEEGDATTCAAKLHRQTTCDELPPCALLRDCELGSWTSWSPCPPTTCIQERTRPVLRREDPGGRPCGPRIQRRVCIDGPCAAYSNSPYRTYT